MGPERAGALMHCCIVCIYGSSGAGWGIALSHIATASILHLTVQSQLATLRKVTFTNSIKLVKANLMLSLQL